MEKCIMEIHILKKASLSHFLSNTVTCDLECLHFAYLMIIYYTVHVDLKCSETLFQIHFIKLQIRNDKLMSPYLHIIHTFKLFLGKGKPNLANIHPFDD